MKTIKINSLTLYLLCILFLTGYLVNGLVIFIIVIIHELGHVLLLKIYNYHIIDITIYPFGGITRVDKRINTNLNKEILIASGGIIIQTLLLTIIYSLPFRIYIKELILKYNLSIMLFNLIPIIPLDGSIILNSILNKFFSFKTSYIINTIISIIGIIVYILINCWYGINNYLIVGLFIYKIYEYIRDYKYIHNRFLLERYLYKLDYNNISTRKGNLDILKINTYQFFKDQNKVVSERKKLGELFDNT